MGAGRVSARWWLAGAAIAALAGVAIWQGPALIGGERGTAQPAAADPTPATAPATATPVAEDVTPVTAGTTPMAERVAVIGFLNKRNGESRDLTLKPGQATRVGDAIVRLRACDKTAPWEQDQFTGAFLQLDVLGTDGKWRRVFSGWVYKERPSLNVVQHKIYDIWPKSCTMRFPESGPDTVSASAASSGPRPSRAPNAPSTEGVPETSPATEAPSAAPSNAL